ncbi:tetratricopeptide repeat protein [candidate division KSB1 bacterium]
MKLSYVLVVILCLLTMSTAAFSQVSQEIDQDQQKARLALRSGNYEEARELFKPLLEKLTGDARQIAMGYFETFIETGEYSEGLTEVESYLEADPQDPYLLHIKGRLLTATGKYEEAEDCYTQSRNQKYDYWRNIVDLAELYELTGRNSQALRLYSQINSQYDRGDFRDADLLAIAAISLAKYDLFHDANQIFRTAYQLDPGNVWALNRWALMFLSKYNNADAQRNFEEALEINPNLADLYTGYARSVDGFSAKESLAQEALLKNPNHVEAMNILAELNIIDSRYDEAEETLTKALDVNPLYMRSLANIASIYHFRNDSVRFAEVEDKAISVKSNCADFYMILADNCAKRFRYLDALEFSRKATLRDARNYNARSAHGLNLLRVGNIRDAKRYLDYAYRYDNFDIFAKNSLDLIDELESFDVLESDHFQLRIHSSESLVLGHYILNIAEEAYSSFEQRYPYEPESKILIEAYNSDADFDVRLAGIPNLDLLGVCFGDIVAIQTPKAREDEPYNWARTLWHELAHVMALGVSDHQVPRWMTEGLSVYEEMQARPEWHRRMEIDLFTALDNDMLLPLNEIDRGFTRPEFEGQVLLSYYQSFKIIEYIADKYGFESVVQLLENFAAKKSVDDSFFEVFGKTSEALNDEFFDSLEEQKDAMSDIISGSQPLMQNLQRQESIIDKLFGGSPSPFFKNLLEGDMLLQEGKYDEAEEKFLNAIEIYPEYTRTKNPYLGLAQIYRDREDIPSLVQILEQYLQYAEYGATESVLLGSHFADEDNFEKSEYFYTRSFLIDPYQLIAHSQLAELYKKNEYYDKESEYRRIILSLDPLDKSKAYYNLALSLFNNKQIPEAKRAVLQALEIAPGYREAQKLLLQCVGGDTGN